MAHPSPESSGESKAARGRVRIDTSGWSCVHWRGRFHPSDLPRSEWLTHYARHFLAVELNATFYRLPSPRSAARRHAIVLPGFRFA